VLEYAEYGVCTCEACDGSKRCIAYCSLYAAQDAMEINVAFVELSGHFVVKHKQQSRLHTNATMQRNDHQAANTTAHSMQQASCNTQGAPTEPHPT
jgi:hypothetical protein